VFRFRLQRLLDYKVVLEKSAEQLLAQAIEEHRRCSGAFQESLDQLQNLNSENQMQNLSYAIHLNFFKEALSLRIKKLKEEVEMAGQEVAACQDKLILARKECLLLEKLKERQLKEYRVELDRKEMILNDELASMRFNRRVES